LQFFNGFLEWHSLCESLSMSWQLSITARNAQT